MPSFHQAYRTLLVAVGFTAVATNSSFADSRDDEIRLLREQIQQLDQKLRVLERKQELKDEEATAASKSAAKVTVNDRGFTLASPDAANSLRLRGLVQADSRWFFDDAVTNNDAFVLRRARIIAEGVFGKIFQFQIVPEFGGGSTTLLDANLNVALKKEFQVRFGKFKSPVGLEQLQSDSWAFFIERSLVSNLVPNRDIGVLVSGDLFSGTLNYTAGVLNGVADGASSTTNTDFDDDKDFVARVFAQPFKNEAGSVLSGLGVGIAANTSKQETASSLTGGYRTDGQQTFFRYRSTVVGDGDIWRVSPQAYWYYGPFGLLGEYVISTANARATATSPIVELQNKAWQLAGSYVLTGEDASYAGVVPKANFDLGAGTWGAFEVTARVANLDVDDAAFPLFADPATSATEATSWGLGVSWYLNRTVRASLNYLQTDFKTAAAAPSGVIRQDEKALITRVQLNF
jgi:phosphate-selective porin OprO and OprP